MITAPCILKRSIGTVFAPAAAIAVLNLAHGFKGMLFH